MATILESPNATPSAIGWALARVDAMHQAYVGHQSVDIIAANTLHAVAERWSGYLAEDGISDKMTTHCARAAMAAFAQRWPAHAAGISLDTMKRVLLTLPTKRGGRRVKGASGGSKWDAMQQLEREAGLDPTASESVRKRSERRHPKKEK